MSAILYRFLYSIFIMPSFDNVDRGDLVLLFVFSAHINSSPFDINTQTVFTSITCLST